VTPRVSVVVPAFNAESTLAESVRPALAGTFRDIEVLVVDDGSTDGTAAVARRLGREDGRVRLLSQTENRGLPAALNRGFAEARGELVARLDADDLWHPDKLQHQVALAERRPAAAFITTWVRFVDDAGLVRFDGPQQCFPPRALARSISETLVGSGSSVLVRREAFEEANGYDEMLRCQEDLFLQVRLSAAHEIAQVPLFLAFYRLRPESLSRDVALMLDTWRKLLHQFRSDYPQVPDRIFRWADAARCAHYAESQAWQGRYGASAWLLAEAMAKDPHRTALWLAERSRGALAKRLGGAKPQSQPPHALALDPAEPFADGQRGNADGALEKLLRRRAAEIAAIDQALAATHHPPGTGRQPRQRQGSGMAAIPVKSSPGR
jgi:glycosyltransferase involved in cell wall biosynthesis